MKKVALLVAGLVALSGVLFLFLFFLQPANWDGRSRFTVVDLGQPVKVLSFDPATNRGIKLTLPGDLWVDTLGGRGRFPINSLASAGPGDWAAGSISSALGIFSGGERRKLSALDKFRWWWWNRRVEWQDMDLVTAGLIEYSLTADGTREGKLAAEWDSKAAEWFSSLTLAQEGLAVRVVNTTSVTGLAANAARQIDSSGMRVLEVASSNDSVGQCQLAGPSSQRKDVGVKLLLRYFGCSWKSGDQLTLYLGEQYRRNIGGN